MPDPAHMPPASSREAPKKGSVLIVVPVYRLPTTPDEDISLRCLRNHLGGYERTLLVPEDLAVTPCFRDFSVRRFPSQFFRSKESYSRLLLSRSFYEAFSGFEHILIHQLDCLVFADHLRQWCDEPYDYIGAPWFRTVNGGGGDWTPRGACVGNGGFSLRRVQAFLRVLDAYSAARGGLRRRARAVATAPAYVARFVAVLRRSLAAGQGVTSVFRNYMQRLRFLPIEDVFWSRWAVQYDPTFRIPTPEKAVAFAIEEEPRFCFDMNKRQLPFGCHAWTRHDRAFWEQFLVR